jgi:hypothetical protein
MRARMLVIFAVLVATFAFPVSAASGASASATGPTLTLERDCSSYPPRHQVTATVTGLPPFAIYFGEIEFPDGTSLGSPALVADANGSRVISGLGVQTPGLFTGTVVFGNVTLVTTLFVNCAVPASKEECKNGGWRDFGVFKNQGDCVSFVATKGKNPPANGP